MSVPGPAEGSQTEQDSQTERDNATDFEGVSPGRTKEYPPSDVGALGSLSPQPAVGESPAIAIENREPWCFKPFGWLPPVQEHPLDRACVVQGNPCLNADAAVMPQEKLWLLMELQPVRDMGLTQGCRHGTGTGVTISGVGWSAK